MIPTQIILHRARVTIELDSPMMIASGQSQHTLDNDLIRDENRRPMIPGTSITGVLRQLLERAQHPLAQMFGFAGQENNQISAIQISSALVHDASNKVREADKSLSTDPLLKLLAQDAPVMRNGVAIDIRGVAADQGKFDRSLVPTGTRFSFEISWWSDQIQTSQWQSMLSLLTHPMCRFGGGSRSGQGAFKLIAIHQTVLDLTQPEQAATFRELPKSLSVPTRALLPMQVNELASTALALLPITFERITLRPENGWRVGGGVDPLTDNAIIAHLLPYTETIITWQNDKASLTPHTLVMPGTSIKGAFSHRLEFHYRRLTQQWAVKGNSYAYRDTDVRQLFGWVDGDDGQIGHLWFNDSYVLDKPQVSYHTRNKIDRLTGGTIDKALFSEERVHNDTLTIELVWDESAINGLIQEQQDKLRKALELTLRDLKTGRLALGAGQNNGAGYFYEVA